MFHQRLRFIQAHLQHPERFFVFFFLFFFFFCFLFVGQIVNGVRILGFKAGCADSSKWLLFVPVTCCYVRNALSAQILRRELFAAFKLASALEMFL